MPRARHGSAGHASPLRNAWVQCALLGSAALAVCSLAAALVLFGNALATPHSHKPSSAVVTAPAASHFAGGLLLQTTASLHDLVREHPFAPSALLPYAPQPQMQGAPWHEPDERWQDRVPVAAIAAYYQPWPQEQYDESEWSWKALYSALHRGHLGLDGGRINAWPARQWQNNGCVILTTPCHLCNSFIYQLHAYTSLSSPQADDWAMSCCDLQAGHALFWTLPCLHLGHNNHDQI